MHVQATYYKLYDFGKSQMTEKATRLKRRQVKCLLFALNTGIEQKMNGQIHASDLNFAFCLLEWH